MSQLVRNIPQEPRVAFVSNAESAFKEAADEWDGWPVEVLGPQAYESWAMPALLQALDGLKHCTPQRMSRWIRLSKANPLARLFIGPCVVYIHDSKDLDIRFCPVRPNAQAMFLPRPDNWDRVGLQTLLSKASAGALETWATPSPGSGNQLTHS